MLRQILDMIKPRTAPPVNVHTVNVGSGGNFKYDPDTIFANIGDVVMFKFYPSNHSVVRGEYTGSSECGNSGCNPCVPYELIHPGGQGFYSENVLTQDGNGSVRRNSLCLRIWS
jgi:plastocyanin